MKRAAAVFAVLAFGIARGQYVPLKSGVVYQSAQPAASCTVGSSPAVFVTGTGCTWYCSAGTYTEKCPQGGDATAGGVDYDVQVNVSDGFSIAPGFTANTTTGAVGTKILNGTRMAIAYASGTGTSGANAYTGWESAITAGAGRVMFTGGPDGSLRYYDAPDAGITVPSNVEIVGDGNAILTWGPDRPLVGGVVHPMFRIPAGASNVAIKNLRFEPGVSVPIGGLTGGSGGAAYIYLGTAGNATPASIVRISDCVFGPARFSDSFFGTQITFEGSASDVTVEDNTFDYAASGVCTPIGHATVQYVLDDVSFTQNKFIYAQTSSQWGYALNLGCGSAPAVETKIRRLAVDRNTGYNTNGFIAINTYFENATVSNNTATSEQMDFCVWAGTLAGLGAVSTGLSVTGNTCSNDFTPHNGTICDAGSAVCNPSIRLARVNGFAVAGNAVYGVSQNGFAGTIVSFSSNGTISGNSFDPDRASAIGQAGPACVYVFDSEGVSITANSCRNPSGIGYKAEYVTIGPPKVIKISGNIVQDTNGTASTYSAYAVIGQCDGCSVHGNTLRSVSAPSGGMGSVGTVQSYGNVGYVGSTLTYKPAFEGAISGQWAYGTAFPVAPATGDLFVVTDDSAAGACDSAAGSTQTLCRWSGSAWVALGGGGGGGGEANTTADVGTGTVSLRGTTPKSGVALNLRMLSSQFTQTNDVVSIGTGAITATELAAGALTAADAAADMATQAEIDLKAPLASPTFTGTVTIPTPFTVGAVSVTPTGTELNFVDGVTSAIQTQIDAKQAADADLSAIASLACADGLPLEKTGGVWACGTDDTGGGGVSDGDKTDITVSAGGTVWTVDADAITYSKIQNVTATGRLLGRSTAGAGDIEEIACDATCRALLDDTSQAAQQTTLGLVPGTNVQAFDADLTDLADGTLTGSKVEAAGAATQGAVTTGSQAFGGAKTFNAGAVAAAGQSFAVTSGCTMDTGVTCPASATEGGFIELPEDSDLGSFKFKLGLGASDLSGDVTCTINASGLIPASCLSGVSPSADDTAYDATSWDGVTTTPPSKNAVRDIIEGVVVKEADIGTGLAVTAGTVALKYSEDLTTETLGNGQCSFSSAICSGVGGILCEGNSGAGQIAICMPTTGPSADRTIQFPSMSGDVTPALLQVAGTWSGLQTWGNVAHVHSGAETHSGAEVFSGGPSFTTVAPTSSIGFTFNTTAPTFNSVNPTFATTANGAGQFFEWPITDPATMKMRFGVFGTNFPVGCTPGVNCRLDNVLAQSYNTNHVTGARDTVAEHAFSDQLEGDYHVTTTPGDDQLERIWGYTSPGLAANCTGSGAPYACCTAAGVGATCGVSWRPYSFELKVADNSYGGGAHHYWLPNNLDGGTNRFLEMNWPNVSINRNTGSWSTETSSSVALFQSLKDFSVCAGGNTCFGIRTQIKADQTTSMTNSNFLGNTVKYDFSPASKTTGYTYGYNVETPVAPGSGSTVQGLVGFYASDLRFDRYSSTSGYSAVFRAEPQTNGGSNPGDRGNLIMAGAGYNTGHYQIGSTHVWQETPGRLRIKSGAPTSDGDGSAVLTTAGRSLTATNDDVAADVELYTRIENIAISAPATTDSGVVQLLFPTAVTITRISCSTDTGTADIQFDERAAATPNTAGSDVLSAALQCDSNEAATTTFGGAGGAGVAARVPLNLDIDAVASTPGKLRIAVEYTVDD